jgi:hypothetical protein
MQHSLKLVTPAEAERVWNTLPRPSARRVAMALAQSGRPVHYTTINRWRKQGWRPVAQRPHPLECAKNEITTTVPVITGDPLRGVDAISDTNFVPNLSPNLSLADTLRVASAEIARSTIQIYQEIDRQHEKLLIEKPRELGQLLLAQAHSVTAAIKAFKQAEAMEVGDKTIVATSETDEDCLGEALEQFRRQTNSKGEEQ